MAKDSSGWSYYKTRLHFNEQVNFILLIMFLAVVVIITIKGCGSTPCLNEKQPSQVEETIVPNDSIIDDSVVLAE